MYSACGTKAWWGVRACGEVWKEKSESGRGEGKEKLGAELYSTAYPARARTPHVHRDGVVDVVSMADAIEGRWHDIACVCDRR